MNRIINPQKGARNKERENSSFTFLRWSGCIFEQIQKKPQRKRISPRFQTTNLIIFPKILNKSSTQNSATFPPPSPAADGKGASPPRALRITAENKEKPILHITLLFFFVFFTNNHRPTKPTITRTPLRKPDQKRLQISSLL